MKTPMRGAGWRLAVCAIVLAAALPAWAADAKPDNKRKPTPEPPVAATVGGEKIYVGEVRDLVWRSRPPQKKREQSVPAEFEAEALELAINRRLVAIRLEQEGFGVGDDELALLMTDLRRKIEAQQSTFEDFLQRHGFNEATVARQLTWDVLWRRYVARAATDEVLEKYFNAHHRDYDGTKLRVSHILLRVAKNVDQAGDEPPNREQATANPATANPATANQATANQATAAVVKKAEKLRAQILAGKLKFAAAASKHSIGASRRQGGDLGWIPRHDRMSEAFSRAAFALEEGDISPPVVDQFGVHLILCTGVEPGRDTWQDVRRPLLKAWAEERFLEVASSARAKAQVSYTSALPHFDPTTRELVGGGK